MAHFRSPFRENESLEYEETNFSGHIYLYVIKPFCMKFLDPTSSDGEEIIELDTVVHF